MDSRRLILFIALSLILLLLWQAWEQQFAPKVAPTAPSTPSTAPSAGAPPEAPGVPAAPSTPGATQPAAPPTAAVMPHGQSISVTTDLLRADIDTAGGDLRRLDLLHYPVDVEHKNTPYALLNDQPGHLFVTESGLIGTDGPYPNHKSLFVADRTDYTLAPGQDRLDVQLTWHGDGLDVVKDYVFHRNSYVVDLTYTITNHGTVARTAYSYAQLLRNFVAPPRHYLSYVPTYSGAVLYTPEKKYRKLSFKDMTESVLRTDTTGGWVGMSEPYFLGAIIPPADVKAQFYSEALPDNRYAIGYKRLSPVTIAPGHTATVSTRLYIGPKEQERLKGVAPGLILTVDYGWLTVIASPLYWIMEQIHRLLGNWGWTIIALTVLIKLAFFPLSAASYKSMAQMRRLQPRMAAIRERHGDDRARMNQAMMELYKTEKINPLGGCLPIVVQIPVFIALYWVLLESVELRQAPFILWIKDLSSPDPYFVLPIIMGASMLAQQLLNPSPLDPLQKKVMMAMPVVFTAFFLFFPAGLVLYWVVSNLLSITQQWWITHKLGAGTK